MKTVILGITGGIAAYKAAELARLFVRSGEEVQVVMTPSAQRFITPLTLQTITGRQVFTDLFAPLSGERVRHVELAEEARVLVVAPATANTLAKMAAGIADNLLTTLFLAVRCPVVLVPSMNENMYEHPAVQENLERLRARGCRIMTPDCGRLACGVIGRGRMPEPAEIFNYVRAVLSPKDFAGVRALVTAGADPGAPGPRPLYQQRLHGPDGLCRGPGAAGAGSGGNPGDRAHGTEASSRGCRRGRGDGGADVPGRPGTLLPLPPGS